MHFVNKLLFFFRLHVAESVHVYVDSFAKVSSTQETNLVSIAKLFCRGLCCNLLLHCICIAGAVLSDVVQLCVYVYIWPRNVRQSK